MSRTEAQRERQNYRQSNGQYKQVNACAVCGKNAGVEYCSDVRFNTTDSAGNDWGTKGQVLCNRCAGKMYKTDDATAYQIITGAIKAPWIKTK